MFCFLVRSNSKERQDRSSTSTQTSAGPAISPESRSPVSLTSNHKRVDPLRSVYSAGRGLVRRRRGDALDYGSGEPNRRKNRFVGPRFKRNGKTTRRYAGGNFHSST